MFLERIDRLIDSYEELSKIKYTYCMPLKDLKQLKKLYLKERKREIVTEHNAIDKG